MAKKPEVTSPRKGKFDEVQLNAIFREHVKKEKLSA
jgi:hypothetical protein